MQKIEKSEIYGVVGTILFGILLILLLFLLKFSYKFIKENEIELAVEEIEESYRSRGSEGSFYRPESATVLENIKPATPKVNPAPAPNLASQNIEQNIALEKAKKEERERREAEAEAERERQRKEAESQRIAAEQKAKADRAKNAMSGMFGSGGQGNKSGSGTGTGNSGAKGEGGNMTGNPVGKGNSNGNSWSLEGRGLVGGIARPSYGVNEEGRITVNIRVDGDGNVVSAELGSPTEISNETLINATLSSARKTKFTAGKGTAYGKITYNFKLN
ncbi:MAG: energy transducer TonB [Prevotellaceae bacterium]|jgi:TonB family protein|nr:energy transducer TonB [Prevotellaceae bacterium]